MSLFDSADQNDFADSLGAHHCNCDCHRKGKIAEKWTIELYKGDATVARENKDNSISPCRTHWTLLIPYALFKNFTRVGNLIFLFVSVVMLSDSTLTPYFKWTGIFPLLFYTVIYVLRVIYIEFWRRRAGRRVNTLKTRKGKREGGGLQEDVQWQNLKPGDIIYLRKDEICPADIVVLDTNVPKNKDMICWVDTQKIDGFTSFTLKKAVNATRVEKGSVRKDNFKEYRKILSGKLEYEAPSAELTKFSGYVKLKKDPRPENFTIENLILRGSVIKNTDWIFGICVYTGHDTKIMMSSSYNREKRSYFERQAEKFFAFGIFLLLLMSVITIVIFLADRTQKQFSEQYPDSVKFTQLFYYIVLYSPTVPIGFYATCDLMLLWRKASIQMRQYKKGKESESSGKKNSGVKVMDPNALPNLGQVDYCFIDKTGTLTTGEYKIKSVYINSKLYKINSDVMQAKVPEFRDKKAKALSNQSSQKDAPSPLEQREQPHMNTSQQKEVTENPPGHPSYQSFIELEIADDPEFQTTQGVFNTYKFKEEIDTRVKNVPGQDFSTSNMEVSNLPLLGMNKGSKPMEDVLNNQDFFTPKIDDRSKVLLSENPQDVSSPTKAELLNDRDRSSPTPLDVSQKKAVFMSPEPTPTHKDDDEQNLLSKGDALNSPSGLDKKVSFNLPETKSAGLYDSKEPPEPVYSENDFMIDYFTLNDKNIEEFNRSLAVCHAARSRYIGDEYIYETAFPEELPQLKFAKMFGKNFIVSNRPDNPSEYTIKENGNNVKYKILGVNDFSYSRKRFSVVYVSPEDNDTTIIYAKGPADHMKQALALDRNELEAYDRIVTKFQERGYKAVAIGRKQMKEEEATEYHKRYQNYKMSLYNQNDDLEALAREVEAGLKLVAIVALQDELRPEAAETIEMLKESDVKVWMLTGDNQENAMNTSYVTGLLNKQIDVQYIKLESKDDAKALIRNILNTIKRQHVGEDSSPLKKALSLKKQPKSISSKTLFDNTYRFAIAIDGDSLELIFRDPYLKANFTFLCALCNAFVGYRFSPRNKKMILSMVKKHFEERPITMAIGDGLNDALMLRSADISIELRANKELLPNNAGDIQLKSLGLLKEIMLIDGRNISDKIEKTLYYTFYKSIVFGAPIFFLNFFSGGTGTALFDSLLMFLYSFLFTFFPVLVFGGHDLSEPEEILLKFPALYIDGKAKKEFIWKNFLVQTLLEGVVHAAIVFFIVTFTVNFTYSNIGLVSDLPMSALAQYFSIIIITNMKLYWLFRRKKVLSFVLTGLSIVCLVIYLAINDRADIIDINYFRESQAIFARAGSVTSMLFVIAFSAMISYIVRHYLVEKVYQSLYDWCAEINAGENIAAMTNEMIAAQAFKPKDLGAIVKNVYKQTELMDSIVQEMLSPADQNVNQLGLKKYQLCFLDKRMEKQYKLMTSRKAIKLSRFIYPVFLLIFGGYALGEGILLKDEVYSFSRMGVFIGFFLVGCVLYTDLYRRRYFDITLFYIFAFYVAKIAFDWTGDEDTGMAAPLLPLASQTLFKVSAFKLAILNVCYFIIFEIRIMVWYFSNDDNSEFKSDQLLSAYSAFSYAFLLIGIYCIISYLGHSFEQDLRNEHSANAKLEIQMNKSNDILSILLPKFIKDKIDKLGGNRNLAEDQGEVTILFCDIMDFDKIILKEGKKVVQLLDYIFRSFDQLCGTHGAQKIETVGKTYMACAGLKSCEIGVAKKILAIHPTRRVLNLALDMEEVIKKTTYGEGIGMRIRIGIHYGRVIAGVIGYHKPQFSLIGDAVNTTSRVCTAKNPGQIRMSDEAYNKMMEGGGAGRSEIYFVPKVEEMKGKGNVKVHIVARKAQNTSFKKKVGQALLKNKEKKVFAVTANPSGEIARNVQRNNIFQNIKDVLNLKTKIEGEAVKVQARGSIGATPSSSFIKTIKDDGEDFPEYEDDDGDVMLLKPHKYFLTLPSHAKHKATEFEADLLGKKRLFQKGSIVGLFIVYLLQTIFMLIIQNQFDSAGVIIGLRIAFLALLITLGVSYQILIRKGVRKYVVCSIFLFGFITSLLQAYWTNEEYKSFHRIQLIELMLLYMVGTQAFVLDFMTSILVSSAMTVAFFIVYGIKGILDIQNIFFFFTFMLANLMHVFLYFRMNIKFYNSLQLREKRKQEQSGLVSQLLPVHAAEKYFSDPTGRVDVSDEFEDVTILYADIKGFTDYSASVEAKDVVTMLSALFTRFDKVCHKYSLYKVYTIGDCYVALSFVNANNRDPGREANNVVKMAMSMVEIIREVRREIKFEELDMRIGIHTGNIIGGIVGTDIVRYDTWGPDVLIANAMESEGVKGHINVSESTKNLLERSCKGLYRFEPYKVVEMEKIESKIPCFLLYSNQNYEEY